VHKDSIEIALQNLNTIQQKTKGKVDILSMINEGLGSLKKINSIGKKGESKNI